MDYLSYNVAVNLKQIRLSKGMSLGEVAENYKRTPHRISDTH